MLNSFTLLYYISRGNARSHERLGHTLYSAAKLRYFSERQRPGMRPLDERLRINDEVWGLLFELKYWQS